MTTSRTRNRKRKSENDAERVYSLALVYVRVSTETQARDGHGLDAQEHRCREYATQKGYAVAAVFSDAYSGGGDFMGRPGMQELFAFLDAHPYENYVVIFDDLKRAARDVAEHLRLAAALKDRHVRRESPNHNFDESPEGQFIETILAGHAQLERQQNKRQVVQKMKARLERGYWTFGPKKGYRHERTKEHGVFAVPSEEGVEILKPALEGFAYGTLPRKIDVCRYLIERGFWKKQRAEKYIDKLTTAILQEPFYCGDIAYPAWGVERRKGQHEGIITPEVFERIQQRLHRDNATTRVRTDISEEFPLRGLLVCSACSRHLTGAPSRNRKGLLYYYYFCQNHECPLRTKGLRKADVERDFRTLLMKNRLKETAVPLAHTVFDRIWEQEVRDRSRQRHMEQQRADELRERVRVYSDMTYKAVGRSETLHRTYENQTEKFAQELEVIEAKLSKDGDISTPYRTALTKATGVLRNPVSIWDSVDAVEKHRLFPFIFEAKLPYTKNAGYRTADTLSTTRLFEELAEANPLDVEVRGIGPRSESGYESESTTHSERYL